MHEHSAERTQCGANFQFLLLNWKLLLNCIENHYVSNDYGIL